MRIDPHAVAARGIVEPDSARRRGEITRWIFGIDAALDRVLLELDVALVESSFSPFAMWICCLIKSIPVTSSVTGCST